MSWRTVLGLGLLMAAVLSGWSAWKHRAVDAPLPGEQQRPDFTLSDFEIITLDEDGKETATLRAPSMERDAADQSMTVATPLFLLPDNSGQPWQLRAKTGWVSAKGEELRLRGEVSGDSPQGAVVTTFRTDSLDVFPQQNLAKTADKVTVTRPGIIHSGVGFQADLKTKQYTLLSQVNARYEPNAAR